MKRFMITAAALLFAAVGVVMVVRSVAPSAPPLATASTIPAPAHIPPPPSVVKVLESTHDLDLHKVGLDAGLATIRDRIVAVAASLPAAKDDAVGIASVVTEQMRLSLDGSFEDRDRWLQSMGYAPIAESDASGAARIWAQLQAGYKDVRLVNVADLEIRVVANGRKKVDGLLPPGEAVRAGGRVPGANPRIEELLDAGAPVVEVLFPMSAPTHGTGERANARCGFRLIRDPASNRWLVYNTVIYMPYENQKLFGMPM